MAEVVAFKNSWTSGEIGPDAQDRVDIQPVQKGCEKALNLIVNTKGPLDKRRGFWSNGFANVPTQPSGLVPFIRGENDAVMLEFGDGEVWVWQANGQPLMDGPDQVNFASPYGTAAFPLRYKQVADVIYVRTFDGQQPQALERIDNQTWQWNVEAFPNGPWLPENADPTSTITVTGTDEVDFVNAQNGSILKGQAITLVASKAIFDSGMVSATRFRLRQPASAQNSRNWIVGYDRWTGEYCQSNGYVYIADPGAYTALDGGTGDAAEPGAVTPPAATGGTCWDGRNYWTYRHDGAGIVQITAVTDAMNASGVVEATVPLISGAVTDSWAESAYSDYRGWPRAWPEMVEERLASGATANNLDFMDLTFSAGFYPDKEVYEPGLGTGLVTDVDALRRRMGADGGEIIWFCALNFMVCGTTSGEYIVSGGLFGQPLAPSTIVCRQIGAYGSADAAPVKAHKGLFFITRGALTVRTIRVDLQQADYTEDVTVLASHLAQPDPAQPPVRSFKKLAWLPDPDEQLWALFSDGTLAVLTSHAEQQVQGWTTVQLGGGFAVEDIAAMPGPGGFWSLWLVVTKRGDEALYRRIWMLSSPTDGLRLDGAVLYEGDPVTSVSGLDAGDFDLVTALTNVGQFSRLSPSSGTVTFGVAATKAQVGYTYPIDFIDLKPTYLGPPGAATNSRQRQAQVTISCLTVGCRVGQVGEKGELVSPRTRLDGRGAACRKIIDQANILGDAERDPRVEITEESAYPFSLYSLKYVSVVD